VEVDGLHKSLIKVASLFSIFSSRFSSHPFLIFTSNDMVSKVHLWPTAPFLIYISSAVATLDNSLGAGSCAGCGRDKTAEQ
jgi:hypothetical protein